MLRPRRRSRALSGGLHPETYRRITGAALGAQIAIVVSGAAVRLTGSGLGCTDWPGCSSDRFVPAWGFHHWVEYGNRLFSLVVLASVVVATFGALRRRPRRRDLIVLSLVLVAGVVAQALLGAVLVLFDLDPRLTVGHFLLSMVLIADAVVLHHRAGADLAPGGAPRDVAVAPSVRRLSRVLVGAGAALIATGTVVTGSGPHGGDDRAARFSLALDTVARIHASTMWLFTAVLVALVVVVRRRRGPVALWPPLAGLVAVTIAQATVGYTQYALGVPAGLVAVHVLGASILWALVVAVGVRAGGRRAPVPAVSEDIDGVESAPVPVLSRG